MTSNKYHTRIQEARELRGMTQKELSEKVTSVKGKNVARETINQWESGTREVKGHDLIALAKALSVSTDFLLGISENPTDDERIQAACEYTGLSLEAVENIHDFFQATEYLKRTDYGNSNQYIHEVMFSILDTLLSGNEGIDFLQQLSYVHIQNQSALGICRQNREYAEALKELTFSLYCLSESSRILAQDLFGVDDTVRLLNSAILKGEVVRYGDNDEENE